LAHTIRRLGVLIFLLVAVTGALAVHRPSTPENGKAGVRGYALALENREGKCVLTYEGRGRKGEYTMGLPAPCEFVRDYEGAPQVHSYYNKKVYGGQYSVLLVTGGPLDESLSDQYMRDGCGTQIQAVMVRASGVIVRKTVLGENRSGPTICPSAGTDEKIYQWLSLSK
jgi:hypothetical protein